MWELLHKLFGGSSPVTGYLGSIIMILDVAKQVIVDGGMPSGLSGWISFVGAFLTGLALRFAKDADVSHSGNPQEPQKVS